MSHSSGGKKKARIEIIPLIDVIFFLLATFVLFTLSLNKSAGVKVNLPGANTAEARDPAGSVTISITDTGSVAWNKDILPTLDQFLPLLKAYQTANPDGRVLINGDADASFGQVFGYVINEVRKAGFAKVYLETRTRGSL